MKRALQLILIVAGACYGQTRLQGVPSHEEINELIDKAEQKVSVFEQGIKAVQPRLDPISAGYGKEVLGGLATARTMIAAIREKGPSAYRLVGLVVTLDDLSLNASTATIMLFNAQKAVAGDVSLLISAKNGCNDIAELIFHATMRLIKIEEDLIGQATSDSTNKPGEAR
jgi:hypothetical protein